MVFVTSVFTHVPECKDLPCVTISQDIRQHCVCSLYLFLVTTPFSVFLIFLAKHSKSTCSIFHVRLAMRSPKIEKEVSGPVEEDRRGERGRWVVVSGSLKEENSGRQTKRKEEFTTRLMSCGELKDRLSRWKIGICREGGHLKKKAERWIGTSVGYHWEAAPPPPSPHWQSLPGLYVETYRSRPSQSLVIIHWDNHPRMEREAHFCFHIKLMSASTVFEWVLG